ncbi:MAG: response regulator [Candidatus Binataceae bacterium]
MTKPEENAMKFAAGGAASSKPQPPKAFIIDDEKDVCLAVSMVLSKLGLTVAMYDNAKDALAALDRGTPKIIFLDVALKQSDAIDVIKGLGERQYTGLVQLFSGNPRLLEPIRRIATRYHLAVRQPLSKPLRREAIAQAVAEAGVGAAVAAAR